MTTSSWHRREGREILLLRFYYRNNRAADGWPVCLPFTVQSYDCTLTDELGACMMHLGHLLLLELRSGRAGAVLPVSLDVHCSEERQSHFSFKHQEILQMNQNCNVTWGRRLRQNGFRQDMKNVANLMKARQN